MIIAQTKGYCLKRNGRTGRLYYLYDASKEMSFCFSLFCEIGQPFVQWFTDVLEKNNIKIATVETERDYFEIDANFVNYWIDKASHIKIEKGF